MKRTLLPFFCAILFSLSGIAQQFSPTARKPCNNCHPDNYTMTNSPSISDVWNPFGSLDDKWNTPNMLLPIPPSAYSQGLSSAQGKNSFATLKTSTGNFDDRLFLDVSGFTVGKTYAFQYSVLSASVHYQAGNNSPYGGSAKMQIVTVGMSPEVLSGSRVTTFDASNRNKWITETITFTAFSTTLQFRLSGSTSGQSAGYINFDIDKNPFQCLIPQEQVVLNSSPTVVTIFPSSTLNLLNIGTLKPTPDGAELVWKTGPNSSDPTLTAVQASHAPISNQDPANVKPYYAFYYDKSLNCYNVPVAQGSAELKFIYQPVDVSLAKSYVKLPCPTMTTDLKQCLANPSEPLIRWFTNNLHSGSPIADPTAVPPGDYYAFYYDAVTNTYSLPSGQPSISQVHVEIDDMAPNIQVVLGQSTIPAIFPGEKLDLGKVRVDSDTPSNTEIVWKTNANSTFPSLTAQQASSVSISNLDPAVLKTYYAFYYSPALDCHTASISTASLNFMHTPTQVPLKQSIVAVSCASPTANLNAVLDNPQGPVIWLKSNNHQGLSVENPQAVSAGDYYAFYYSIIKGGFSLPVGQVSTAHIKVENPMLAGIPDLGPTMNINSMIFPPNGSKDFVVGMQNIKAENSNCSVYFLVSKLPGFSITYSTQAGQSNVNGGMPNNNDLWTFSEDAQYIKVTAKNGMAASASSNIGFKITRNANTPAGAKQNLAVTVPLPGGGGETNASNNQTITTLTTN